MDCSVALDDLQRMTSLTSLTLKARPIPAVAPPAMPCGALGLTSLKHLVCREVATVPAHAACMPAEPELALHTLYVWTAKWEELQLLRELLARLPHLCKLRVQYGGPEAGAALLEEVQDIMAGMHACSDISIMHNHGRVTVEHQSSRYSCVSRLNSCRFSMFPVVFVFTVLVSLEFMHHMLMGM
eukprot:jgi/Ulvmu1/12433/UM009_0084.1